MVVKPRAGSGVIARPVGNEVVIYNSETHTAHCLNRTAAIVFRSANGDNSVAEIARLLALETGTDADEDVVWVTLERLVETKLIAMPSAPATVSRRRALRQVGLGAAALAPIVVSLVVPTPAEAAATCIQAPSCSASTIGNSCYVLSQTECLTKVCTGNPGECL